MLPGLDERVRHTYHRHTIVQQEESFVQLKETSVHSCLTVHVTFTYALLPMRMPFVSASQLLNVVSVCL